MEARVETLKPNEALRVGILEWQLCDSVEMEPWQRSSLQEISAKRRLEPRRLTVGVSWHCLQLMSNDAAAQLSPDLTPFRASL